MAERFKAHAWKVCVLSKVPRVRIPVSPPLLSVIYNSCLTQLFLDIRICRAAYIMKSKNLKISQNKNYFFIATTFI